MTVSVIPEKYMRMKPKKQLVSMGPYTDPGTPLLLKASVRNAYLMEEQILNDIQQSMRRPSTTTFLVVSISFLEFSGSFPVSEI